MLYVIRMIRLTFTGVVLTALFMGAVRLPAQACAVLSPPIGKSCQQGCCANKACCAESQNNKSLPSQPLAKDSDAGQQLVAVVFHISPSFSPQLHSLERTDLAVAKIVECDSPRLAVLCTFLI